jgi:hypothetical protein
MLEQERINGDKLSDGGALVLQLFLHGTDENAEFGQCCHGLEKLVRT